MVQQSYSNISEIHYIVFYRVHMVAKMLRILVESQA